MYIIKFDKHMAETTATHFVQQYLFMQLNIKYLLIGEDFKFGKQRSGDVSLLKTLGEAQVVQLMFIAISVLKTSG